MAVLRLPPFRIARSTNPHPNMCWTLCYLGWGDILNYSSKWRHMRFELRRNIDGCFYILWMRMMIVRWTLDGSTFHLLAHLNFLFVFHLILEFPIIFVVETIKRCKRFRKSDTFSNLKALKLLVKALPNKPKVKWEQNSYWLDVIRAQNLEGFKISKWTERFKLSFRSNQRTLFIRAIAL